MRFSSARSLRLVFASLVTFAAFGQLNNGVARADDDTCALSQVGSKCVGSDGGTLFTTCLAITTTTTAQDGGMSNATAGGCVLIEGTYCSTTDFSHPCTTPGDTCEAMAVATSSGSTGGGEQTSATSYSYGLCEVPDAGTTDEGDDAGATSESSGDASATTGSASTGTATADGGTTTTIAAGDAGTTGTASSDSSDGGCTVGQSSSENGLGAFALIAGVGALGLASRRRRSPR